MINDKKNLRDDDDAVSPVIGVILMVAITVIMAAVIGAFVYGYGGSMETTKNVAAVAHFTNKAGTDYVSITYMGGPDQSEVNSLSSKVYKEAGGEATLTSGSWTSAVGCTVTYGTDVDGRGKNHVIVTATYPDDTSSVILDTFV